MNLEKELRLLISPRLDNAKKMVGVVGPSAAFSEAVCECLIATCFKDGPALFQVTQITATLDRATPEIPFRVTGSGQMCADPFVRFLQKIFWVDRLPTVDEGILAAYWAVEYAIEVGAPGVGPPSEVYALRRGKTKYFAERIGRAELQTHADFIQGAREQLKALTDVKNPTADDASQIPTLESSGGGG